MVGHVFLGKYKATRLLDEGGMSKVYLARQTNPDREVVVKVLKETLLALPKVREHFRREIHITSHFQHLYAVAFIDADPDATPSPVLVLEYVRGVDLNVLLHRDKRFTPERAGRLLAQLCNVLQAAHDVGVVHRDLKPGNLMILYPGTPLEQLRLMDFGLAKMSSLLYISPDELFDYTLPAAAGTPEYIAPEQVRGNEMDGRGDLYSVGVLLYEMLTGRRPFQGDSVQALMRAHADQEPPTFAALGLAGPIAPAVERVVRACLAKHPDHRPPSALELLQRYELALGKRFPLPRRSTRVPTVRDRTDPDMGQTPAPTRRLPSMDDPEAVRHSIEASMPESMAMLKLKGFIHDLGGEIVESVPGLIRVRLAEPVADRKPTLFDWMDRKRRTTVQAPTTATDIELHMRRPDPSRPGRLTVTLVLRAATASLRRNGGRAARRSAATCRRT